MGSIFSKPADLADRNFKKSLHGALMLWSWGVFLPGGVAMATWGRGTLNGPLWFFAHRSLGYAGVLLAAAGTLVARAVSSGNERAALHRLIGYATTLLGLAQPIIAYYRPEPKTEEEKALKAKGQWKPRSQWFALHKYLGWLCIALGLYNIRQGLGMWDPDSALSSAYAAGLVAIGGGVSAWNIAYMV